MASVDPMATSLDVDDDVELLAPEVEPMPEEHLHRVLVDQMAAGLSARFAAADDVAVFARLAWFPDRDKPALRLDPDVMVVFGRPPGQRRSFKAWVEGGAVPAVIIEVRSQEDSDLDYHRRLGRAYQYGVPEVVVVNPHALGGAEVRHLRAGVEGYQIAGLSTDAGEWVPLESLGIRMAGGDSLHVREGDREWPTTAGAFQRMWAEMARADREAARTQAEAVRADRQAAFAAQERARADEERKRAEHERKRAEHERKRADEERERADRLLARLRAAGLEPGADLS